MKADRVKGNQSEQKLGLGAFTGVFVPNVLTILGVILFMRVGWVVGEVGLVQALSILLIANSVTLLTTLSLSAIATSAKVGGGGAYFMISRSLGLEIGGSIGVPLFFAQAVSVAFYAIGFSESLLSFFPDLNVKLVAAVVITLLFALTWRSSSIAFKAQNVIFVILALSLGSFFLGSSPDGLDHSAANYAPLYSEGVSFWVVFAIFFPAVTGVMAGASMSGDLKNPAKSIPWGTLASVILTFLVYAAQMFWLSRHADRESLIGNPLVMQTISISPALIYLGLWAATLSSALASLMAAPRTLQALANDGVLPQMLGKTHGPLKEPRVGLIVSFLIALFCVGLGELDLIAPIISMFFLATYGMTNGVAFLEAVVSNPSYRPSFKSHWIFSLAGAVGCFGIMLLLNVWATLLAITFIILFYIYLLQKRYETAWGDMRSGFWFSLTRFGLLKFEESQQHLRNWRPVIMVLAGNPNKRKELVEFAYWMESNRGFLFLAQIIVGERLQVLPRADGAREVIDTFISENKLSAVSQVITTNSFDEGVIHLLQVAGVGPIVPNTVMLGWNQDALMRERYQQAIQAALSMQKNLLLFVKAEDEYSERFNKTIDVWWRSRQNGILMATLAYLLSSNSRWRRHKIRIMMIVEDPTAQAKVKENLENTLSEIRIKADVNILNLEGPIDQMIISNSQFSEVCFLGINLDFENKMNDPMVSIDRLANAFHGNLLIAKNWEDLNKNWES